MQTILGASGIIGKELAKNLPNYTDRIRLVNRNPKNALPGCEFFKADLLDAEQTLKAVEGSEIVYLTAGLQYNIKVWQAQWPVIMQNVITACRHNGSKLVFFDNVYLYGRVNGWMKEDTPVRPASKKGAVRAQIAGMLMDEAAKGNLKALIARAADFYGPDSPLSFVNAVVFENYKKGKKAQCFISDRHRHSYTYTPDAGKATAILGNSDKAYGQVWHLPTDYNVLTNKAFIENVAEAFGVEPKYQVLNRLMIRMAGLFVPEIRESIEMLYQNDQDYLFDSSRFQEAYSMKPTPYAEGIRVTAQSMQ